MPEFESDSDEDINDKTFAPRAPAVSEDDSIQSITALTEGSDAAASVATPAKSKKSATPRKKKKVSGRTNRNNRHLLTELIRLLSTRLILMLPLKTSRIQRLAAIQSGQNGLSHFGRPGQHSIREKQFGSGRAKFVRESNNLVE
jgi:hypothetical protein